MSYTVIQGDARKTGLPDAFFHCVATSPPYFGLREYGDDDREIGDEKTPDEYIEEMRKVGREVWRVLREDGTWWLNLGDSYAGSWGNQGRKETRGGQRAVNAPMIQRVGRNAHDVACAMGDDCTCGAREQQIYQQKVSRTGACDYGVRAKSLIMVPHRVALALQADGWIVRAMVPWFKMSGMPENVHDRPTVMPECVFLLSRAPSYFWDAEAVRQPSGRNIRTADMFRAALDEYELHMAHIRENGGLLLSPDGDPLVFMVNPSGSSGGHFATWPPRLVAPMIKASTSERGCCAECGAQWQRVEAEVFVQRCECNAGDPVPCRVLDPFAGSGTTMQVCEALGRNSWGVELMAKNIPIIGERLKERLEPESMKPTRKQQDQNKQFTMW